MAFSYSGKEAKLNIKLFEDTELNIAIRTHNAMENISKPTPQT
jgi:hypothetical protein